MKYEVKDVVCDYGVYDGKGNLCLICNSRRNALLIADIMTSDSEWKHISESPYPDGDKSILACSFCGSGEYLHNEDGNKNHYCGQCGKAIDWGKE